MRYVRLWTHRCFIRSKQASYTQLPELTLASQLALCDTIVSAWWKTHANVSGPVVLRCRPTLVSAAVTQRKANCFSKTQDKCKKTLS